MSRFWLTLAMLLSSNCKAAIDDLIPSVCQVNGGTGTVFKITDEKVYVITAAHVVLQDGNEKIETKIWCRFYHTGKMSEPYFGKVEFYKYNPKMVEVDFAIVSFKRAGIKSLPPAFSLKFKKGVDKDGEKCYTVGRPGGNAWPTGLIATISRHSDTYYYMEPKPIPGRSGSLVVHKDNRVVGMVIHADGGCISCSLLSRLYKEYESK